MVEQTSGPSPYRPGPPRAGGLPPIIGTALAAAILLFAGGGTFAGGYFTNAAVDDDDGGGPAAVATAPSGSPTVVVQPTEVPLVAASVDDDPAWGPEDAAVTIIEFSDFQCPYCARFRTDTYDQIRQNYEGQVRFVYRDFPLSSIHPWAQKAAEAAECADDQGKFWEYHDAVYQNQTAVNQEVETAQTADATAGLTAALNKLKGLATDLGLDSTAFSQCLDSDKYAQEVQKDYQDGISYGVQGTPAFYINGALISGAQPFANFQTVIDAALQAGG